MHWYFYISCKKARLLNIFGLSLKISWEPGSQVPSHYPTLHIPCRTKTISYISWMLKFSNNTWLVRSFFTEYHYIMFTPRGQKLKTSESSKQIISNTKFKILYHINVKLKKYASCANYKTKLMCFIPVFLCDTGWNSVMHLTSWGWAVPSSGAA